MPMNKRSIMSLYAGELDIYSHMVRIVLAEKNINVDIKYVDTTNPSEDLLAVNPYNTVPTLVDRDLVLYETNVIIEYLDERFPHPPLLPVYPIARAKCRLMTHRIQEDWFSLIPKIQSDVKSESDTARKKLHDNLVTLTPVFSEMPYFLSEEFSIVDCWIAPLLWRLRSFGIKLPTQAKGIIRYAERIFNRDSFRNSLSELEKELKEINM